MAESKIPPQILRLIVLMVAIGVVYWIANRLLTPASFGHYGHYRADVLDEKRAQAWTYVGKKGYEGCTECHAEQVEDLAKFGHKTLACEVCHGPLQAHGDNPDAITPVKVAEGVCLRCHERRLGRPDWMKQVDPAEHYPGDKCEACHIPHKPSETP